MIEEATGWAGRRVRIAVDIGGTFTDLQVLDEASGASHAHKTPTTPDDPSEGLLTGLGEAARRFGFDFGDVSVLIHGTTIATNAVLERKLPAGALVTTAGFEDVLEIGRHLRRDVYANKAEPRTLLIPRSRRFGLHERTRADGTIEVALDEADVAELAPRLRDCGAETVAVTLLHSYANPDHERRVAACLERHLPGVPVSLSSDISPEFREFERTSTTALNALLMPVVGTYLRRLETRLSARGFDAPVFLVQSNGGLATPDMAARQPARLLLSGPSGGARAAETIAHHLDRPNLVAVDMGGTSYDVSLVEDGRVHLVNEGEVDACPVRLPMVEMRTIGAGGGSIAKVDAGGGLSVGPDSAGADPGPACYGRGGGEATVTDANVVVGRIDPAHFLGGAMPLDAGAARRAMSGRVAGPLGLDAEETAEGIIQIAVAHMASAIRLSLYEKGLDPADFALLSFGGAGGLHACETAAELGIERVVFPADPGTLSAWGMLFADITHDMTQARLMKADADGAAALRRMVADLGRMGTDRLRADGADEADRRLEFTLDLRYPGQAYEIATPFADIADTADTADTTDALAQATTAFHELHHAQYAHADPAATPEIVNLRLRAVGLLAKPEPRETPSGDGVPSGRRRIFLAGQWSDVKVFDRAGLQTDRVLSGPLIIEDPHSTIFIIGGWSVRRLASGALVANLAGGDAT